MDAVHETPNDDDVVRRRNLNTGFHRDMPFGEALDEITKKAKSQYRNRFKVAGRLAEGEKIEIGIHTYEFRD